MRFIRLVFFVSVALITSTILAQEKKYKVQTVAFYNVENLFDTEDDELTFDEDFTPEGSNAWTEEKYEGKLERLAKVISEIGVDLSQNAPVILGLCEVENRKVLEDLINEPALLKYDYGIAHFDSPDRRGIDVALLYQKAHFRLMSAKALPLIIYNKETGERVYTRDQLVVSGMMGDEKLHFIVNHWPSRRGGEERSRPNRLKAAELNKKIIDSLQATDPYAKIIGMGDFNDDPTNASFKEILKTHRNPKKVPLMGLYNPMENMLRQGMGTLAYRDGWNLFDQIYMTKPMLEKDSKGWIYYKAGIYNKAYLANPRGRYKGYPFRATEGGYSDHFPVYIHIIKDVTELLEVPKN